MKKRLPWQHFSFFHFSSFGSQRKGKKGNLKSTWRPSKIEAKDGFTTHLRSHSELQENITRRKEKYTQLGVTLQPLIIIVGPNIN